MSTDIPFILDALQTASTVQMQVDFLHYLVLLFLIILFLTAFMLVVLEP